MVLLGNCACSRIEVYSISGKKDYPTIYGTYLRQAEKVNGRPFYTSDAYGGKFGIWWLQDDTYPVYQWQIGYSSKKGGGDCFAANVKDADCPQSLKHFSWWIMYGDERWRLIGYDLGIRCHPDDDLKGHEGKLDLKKVAGNEPKSHDQSPANTKITKILTLLISKP